MSSPDQRDLRDLFAAAAAEERAAADPLDVAALLGRAHRRRAVRGTTYSAIGLGTAAAITLGAVSADGLWRDDEPPVPPATETATTRPTPTPTAEPAEAATPTPDAFAPDWEMCGTERIDEFRDEEHPIWLAVEQNAERADTPVPVDAALTSAEDAGEIAARVVGAYAFEWLEGDRAAVVGVAGAPLDVRVTGSLTAGGTIAVPHFDVPLTSCEASPLVGGDGSLTTTLDPAGWYVLVLVVDVTTADGVTTRMDLGVFNLGTQPDWGEAEPSFTPGPKPPTGQVFELTPGTPLRLTTGQTMNATNDTWDELVLSCGTPVQRTLPDAGKPTLTTAATAFVDGGELVVRVSMTNTSTQDLTHVSFPYPSVDVSRDGATVGRAWLDGKLTLPWDAVWRRGETLEVEWSLGPNTCAFVGDEPWPAGEYAIDPSFALVYDFNLPDGPTATGFSERITGGPFPFTLD